MASSTDPSPVVTDPADALTPRHWIHPHARRYYTARLFRNLFGHWELEQAWGSLTTRHGRLCYVPLASLAEGQQQMAAVAKRRAQRGYVIAER